MAAKLVCLLLSRLSTWTGNVSRVAILTRFLAELDTVGKAQAESLVIVLGEVLASVIVLAQL